MTDRLWYAAGDGALAKRSAPSALRNRGAIADVVGQELPATGTVLEIASGSGEHIVHFARRFPALDWQPSDPDAIARSSIAAHAAEACLPNIHPPVDLDAACAVWPLNRADAILCINMTHISAWEATVGLFTTGGKLLSPGAPLILYGPYIREGYPTAPSNLAFDADLKARNSLWGIRKLEDVTGLAESVGFTLDSVHEMPANNLTVVYRRV
jgi:hypothetical protein